MKPPRVIVGTDGSPENRPALRWATAEAARRGVSLHIIAAAWPNPRHSPERAEAKAFDSAARIVAAAVGDARRWAPGVDVAGEPVLGGPAAALVAAAGRHDLLVVGQRGHSEFASVVTGSTCQQVALQAYTSVAVVRGRSEPETGPIVVGYDGSPTAEAILLSAFEMAEERHCALTVIRAFRTAVPTWPGPPAPVDRMHDTTKRFALTADIRYVITPMTEKYPDVTVDILATDGDPAWVLVEASRDARLVVVGSRGHGGFAGLLLGSVGLHLLHHSDCPVLIARP